MSVIGAFTNGGDGTSNANATGVALAISGAGTPAVGDIPVQITVENSGTNTLSSTSPTLATQSGPNVSGATSSYLTAETAGLTSGDISGDAITHTWSGGARNLAGGVLLRGRTMVGAVIGTPTKITTGATITIPTVTAVAGSDVVVWIAAKNAQATAPTIDVAAVMVAAGWTVGRAVVTVGASPNIAVTTFYKANVAAGNYGGETPAVTNTPVAQHAYTIAVPAAAAAPSAPAPRRRASASRRRTSAQSHVGTQGMPVKSQPIRGRLGATMLVRRRARQLVPPAVAASIAPSTPQRRRTLPITMARHRAVTPVPAQVFQGPLYPTQIQRVRRPMPRIKRGSQVSAPVPPVAVTPPTYPVAVFRHRIWLGKVTRGRHVSPVPAQVVVTAPALVQQPARRHTLLAFLGRHRPAQHIPGTGAPHALPAAARRRPAVRTVRRVQVVPTHGAPTLHTILPRRRLLGFLPRRRVTPVVPTQVVLAPAFVSSTTRNRRRLVTPKRGRHVTVYANTVAPITTPGSMSTGALLGGMSTAANPGGMTSSAPVGAGMTTATQPGGMTTGPRTGATLTGG